MTVYRCVCMYMYAFAVQNVKKDSWTSCIITNLIFLLLRNMCTYINEKFCLVNISKNSRSWDFYDKLFSYATVDLLPPRC